MYAIGTPWPSSCEPRCSLYDICACFTRAGLVSTRKSIGLAACPSAARRDVHAHSAQFLRLPSPLCIFPPVSPSSLSILPLRSHMHNWFPPHRRAVMHYPSSSCKPSPLPAHSRCFSPARRPTRIRYHARRRAQRTSPLARTVDLIPLSPLRRPAPPYRSVLPVKPAMFQLPVRYLRRREYIGWT